MFAIEVLEKRKRVLEDKIRFLKSRLELEKDRELFKNELQETEEMLNMVNVELLNVLKQLR